MIICRTFIERCNVDICTCMQHMCNTYVPGVRYACLGCWSRQALHAMHSAQSCGNTQWIRSELFTRSCENPDRSRHKKTDYMHNFTQTYFVNDAIQATSVLTDMKIKRSASFGSSRFYQYRNILCSQFVRYKTGYDMFSKCMSGI